MAKNIHTFSITAASALMEGRHDEAISLFRMALRDTRRLVAKAPTSSQNAQVNALSDSSRVSGIAAELQAIRCFSRTERNNGDVAGFQFFNRVFTMKNVIMPRDQDRLALIVLFNIAVAHHQKGISTGSSEQLVIAMRYYTMACDLIHHAAKQRELDSFLLLMLALWNNIGNIHSHFSDLTEASKCSQWIEMLITCFDGSGLEEEDYDFFRLNFLVDNLQLGVSIAPAA